MSLLCLSQVSEYLSCTMYLYMCVYTNIQNLAEELGGSSRSFVRPIQRDSSDIVTVIREAYEVRWCCVYMYIYMFGVHSCRFELVPPLFTLGAHAQRGLGLSFRLSVCYYVFCHYAQQGGQKAIPTGSVPHWLDFKNGDFRKSTAFKSYGLKTKRTSQYANEHGLPRPDSARFRARWRQYT